MKFQRDVGSSLSPRRAAATRPQVGGITCLDRGVCARAHENEQDPTSCWVFIIPGLRRKTRDGTDLFFLHLAVQEVGRISPEHAREAEGLRARLYDHIPPPPEKLFRWIETPADGRVPL